MTPLYIRHIWSQYGQQLGQAIIYPQYAGSLDYPEGKGYRLIIADEGSSNEGNFFTFYWWVDEKNGLIVNVRYRVFGTTVLIGALEAVSRLIIEKNYIQAERIEIGLIQAQWKEKFPTEAYPYIDLVISGVKAAASQCADIVSVGVISPVYSEEGTDTVYEEWDTLTLQEKLLVIERVIKERITPYLQLDEGGVRVIELLEENKVIIAYEGACTSCYASQGATLQSIQHILQTCIHPTLVVIPDTSFLHSN